jgi:hypothetical protein
MDEGAEKKPALLQPNFVPAIVRRSFSDGKGNFTKIASGISRDKNWYTEGKRRKRCSHGDRNPGQRGN